MKKTITFGELMIRFSPKGYLRFSQADALDFAFGGAEANVAVNLACMGEAAGYVTVLPDNAIADVGVNFLRGQGVDVSGIIRRGERMGAYYVEKGASQRASKVVYDRKHSAVSALKEGEVDWQKAFHCADFFFTSGITAALGGDMPAVTLESVKAAKAAGVTVAFDINYRATLWTKAEAGRAIEKILPYVDILITNVYQADDVLNIRGDEESVCAEIARKFGIKKIYTTARESKSASVNVISAALYDGGRMLRSREYEVNIVDRVGAGDAFAAGVIYGEKRGWSGERTLGFALAASALKHSVEGDFNLVSAKEIEDLAGGDGSGMIVR